MTEQNNEIHIANYAASLARENERLREVNKELVETINRLLRGEKIGDEEAARRRIEAAIARAKP